MPYLCLLFFGCLHLVDLLTVPKLVFVASHLCTLASPKSLFQNVSNSLPLRKSQIEICHVPFFSIRSLQRPEPCHRSLRKTTSRCGPWETMTPPARPAPCSRRNTTASPWGNKAGQIYGETMEDTPWKSPWKLRRNPQKDAEHMRPGHLESMREISSK